MCGILFTTEMAQKDKIKLLVVDDELDICTAVQSYFGRRGFIVSTTGSGHEALSMIKTAKPDLVLLDITLNDLNGVEVLRKLREHDKETKIIIITGQMYPESQIQEIIELGVSGYENKPFVLGQIERLVCEAIGRKLPVPIIKIKKKRLKDVKVSKRDTVHKLSNLLGIIRNKCENFALNVEEGVYNDKSDEELVKMSVQIMKDIEDTVDRAMNVVDEIKVKI